MTSHNLENETWLGGIWGYLHVSKRSISSTLFFSAMCRRGESHFEEEFTFLYSQTKEVSNPVSQLHQFTFQCKPRPNTKTDVLWRLRRMWQTRQSASCYLSQQMHSFCQMYFSRFSFTETKLQIQTSLAFRLINLEECLLYFSTAFSGLSQRSRNTWPPK